MFLSFICFTCVGCARNIIVAERVVLNFMQRMSGIATLTKVIMPWFEYFAVCTDHATAQIPCYVLDLLFPYYTQMKWDDNLV